MDCTCKCQRRNFPEDSPPRDDVTTQQPLAPFVYPDFTQESVRWRGFSTRRCESWREVRHVTPRHQWLRGLDMLNATRTRRFSGLT